MFNAKEYYQKNKEKMIARAKARRAAMDPEERKRIGREYSRAWRAKNPEKWKVISKKADKVAYKKNQFNPQYRLSEKIGFVLRKMIKSEKCASRQLIELSTGISRQDFAQRFKHQPKYSFDHIVPLSAFDLTNPVHLLKANHLSNLRYIPLSENSAKGPKLLEPVNIDSLPYNTSLDAMQYAIKYIKTHLTYCQNGQKTLEETTSGDRGTGRALHCLCQDRQGTRLWAGANP